ncbi:putative ferric-chelate reductase 1 [Scophthalmus maximus]|uniref:Putative ferric-chelate reductase 1 n=1 Tax=Scophthalmus maximus TaxID=52904 RepID=A0A2U9B008_SCOMX|nr:putative ferric-chelate reductase 1 [Scophthalmus maximus]
MTSPTTHNMSSPTTHNMTSPMTHNMTSAPQLTVNTTVETLDTPVSNTGCGTEQLCASEPSNCDPSTGASCFFFSAKQQPGSQNLEFSLSGESEGYIAATLSPDATLGDNDPTYICANNNSFVQFFSTVLVNGSLTQTELSVNSVKGKVNGKKIQCTFTATVPNSATRRPRGAPTDAAILISTGAFNNNSGTLGSPTAKFSSDVVNLSNPNTTVTNQLSTNTTSSPTTAHAITFQQTLMQVLLISVGALSLALV